MLITHNLGVVAETCDRVIVMYAGQVIEVGKVDEVLKHPFHPYTKGLLYSIPRLKETRKRLDTIPGTVPQLGEMPSGCRFSPRCCLYTEKCKYEPTLIGIGPQRYIKCWNAL